MITSCTSASAAPPRTRGVHGRPVDERHYGNGCAATGRHRHTLGASGRMRFEGVDAAAAVTPTERPRAARHASRSGSASSPSASKRPDDAVKVLFTFAYDRCRASQHRATAHERGGREGTSASHILQSTARSRLAEVNFDDDARATATCQPLKPAPLRHAASLEGGAAVELQTVQKVARKSARAMRPRACSQDLLPDALRGATLIEHQGIDRGLSQVER